MVKKKSSIYITCKKQYLHSGVYGTDGLMTSTQLNSGFRPYYTVKDNYMVWHDYAVIKLNYLFESLNKLGLVQKLDAQLRLWVNTGTVMVTVTNPDANKCGYVVEFVET